VSDHDKPERLEADPAQWAAQMLMPKATVESHISHAIRLIKPAKREKECRKAVEEFLPILRNVHEVFDQNERLPDCYRSRLKRYERALVGVLSAANQLPRWRPQRFIATVQEQLRDTRHFLAMGKRGAKPFSWAKVAAVGHAERLLAEFSLVRRATQLDLAVALCRAAGLFVGEGEDLSGYCKGPVKRFVSVFGFTTEGPSRWVVDRQGKPAMGFTTEKKDKP
jgi:hypothetical protein